MQARLLEVHLNFIVHALNDEEDGERGGNGGRDKDRKQRPRRVTEDFALYACSPQHTNLSIIFNPPFSLPTFSSLL